MEKKTELLRKMFAYGYIVDQNGKDVVVFNRDYETLAGIYNEDVDMSKANEVMKNVVKNQTYSDKDAEFNGDMYFLYDTQSDPFCHERYTLMRAYMERLAILNQSLWFTEGSNEQHN